MLKFVRMAAVVLTICPGAAGAEPLTVATVTRPPFSMVEEGRDTGFSIALWEEISTRMGREYELLRLPEFADMMAAVSDGKADLAIANISITATREKEFDFSQPIFESGLQIMIPRDGGSKMSVLKAVFSPSLLGAIAIALGLLLLAGMVMWRLERRHQPYFDAPPRKALFPAFWWALNLVVNGGFEERIPRTLPGRIFGVVLVVSSLFVVSFFVANVTAIMTVDAISGRISSVNDLYGKTVATTSGSTSSAFLEARELRHRTYADLETLLADFEAGKLDAVVFDAPILAYYVNRNPERAALAGATFRRENYGIVLPTGSGLTEDINQTLLRLREDGTYDRIRAEWFGNGN